MADELVRLVERPDLPEYAKAASASVSRLDWEAAGAKVVEIIDQVSGGSSS